MPAGGNFTGCCGSNGESCQNPTEPVTTVGLCLADGRPIAVTVVRDCAGGTVQEGWLDLTTGQWTAGPPPEGTGACTGQRAQFEVGQWCDLDPDGSVIAPVLVEYEYGELGQLVGVRTLTPDGEPYEVAGTLGLCPAGADDSSPPEPCRHCETVILCDTITPSPGDSPGEDLQTVVTFLRTLCRDCDGTIIDVTDTLLDGTTAYVTQGEVGSCHPPADPGDETSPPEPCLHCTTTILCDTPTEVEPELLQPGATSGVLASGVGWQMDCAGPDPQGQTGWWQWAPFPCPTDAPLTVTFDRPVAATWAVRVGQLGTLGRVVMPAGTVPVEIHPDHDWDPDTLTLLARPGAGTAFGSTAVSRFAHPSTDVLVFPGDTGGAGSVARRLIGEFTAQPDPVPVPFARTLCYGCDGQIVSTTDTTLTGEPYEPAGEVGVCHQPETKPCAAAVQVLRLCDLNPDTAPDEQGRVCATPFLRHLVFGCEGQVTTSRDTTLTGEPYEPVRVVDCGTHLPALSELQWPLTSIDDDPDGTVGRDYVYTLTHPETGEVARVRLSTTSDAGGPCDWEAPPGPDNPPVFNNPTTYTYTLDEAAQQMDRFALDFLDLDTFEGIHGLSPIPDAVQWLEGSGVWNGDRIDADVNNSVVRVFWNTPPGTIRHSYSNSGGGFACHSAILAGITMRPEGCCSCDDGGESPGPEPCRDSSTLLLCDVATLDTVTVLDTTERADADGWQLTAFDNGGCGTIADPDGPVPGPPVWSADGYLSPRADRQLGPACGPWSGYDTASVRWVLTKTFEAPQDGVAVVEAAGFAGDGGARVRINGRDVGLYGQWDQPAVSGSNQVPVTAGPNVIEVEVRDNGGPTWVRGRLDVVMSRTTQFFRHVVTDCETGQVVSVADTTLDGEPYEVAGEVGQCEPIDRQEPCGDTELVTLCDTTDDGTTTVFLRRLVFDCYGQTTSAADLTLDGQPYEPTGQIGLCHTPTGESPGELCQVVDTFTTCGCDDLTEESDGEIVCYTNVWGVDCDGQVSLVHTYRDDPAVAYTPTNPVPCQEVSTPGDPIVGVQTQRLQLDPGQAWAATTVPLLQTVTISAHGGEGQVTTEAGVSTLFEGESVTWSVVHEYETVLRGPLTVQATSGVVTVTYTEGVTA